MPIAYTWGKGHKIKILISSSNHPRYQVNANLPIDDGTYYLREPMDGQYLNYNGQMFAARKAVQRIAFYPTHPTHLELPIYQEGFTKLEEVSIISNDKLLVFPNPTSDMISIYLEKPDIYQLRMYEMSGKVLLEKNIQREYFLAMDLGKEVEKTARGSIKEVVRVASGAKKPEFILVIREICR